MTPAIAITLRRLLQTDWFSLFFFVSLDCRLLHSHFNKSRVHFLLFLLRKIVAAAFFTSNQYIECSVATPTSDQGNLKNDLLVYYRNLTGVDVELR